MHALEEATALLEQARTLLATAIRSTIDPPASPHELLAIIRTHNAIAAVEHGIVNLAERAAGT